MVEALVVDGLNDCEIARRTGIPRRTISDWRRGRVRPRPGRDDCIRCGGPDHDKAVPPAAPYAYLLGQYLGDGHIVAGAGKTPVLRVFCAASYPDIVNEVDVAMSTVLPTNRTWRQSKPGCTVVLCSSRQLPCLFPQHGPGRKHERRIALTEWQRALLDGHDAPLVRGLLHSDGARTRNRVRAGGREYVYPRYEFSNRSADILGIFCEALDRLGVAWRPMGPHKITIARREAVAALDAVVGPKS